MYCCYYLLCSLVVFSWVCGSEYIHETEFEIFRSKHDMFQRLKCYPDTSGNKTSKCFPDPEQLCHNNTHTTYNAECVNSTCEYCRCLKGHNTFMISKDNPNHGECKTDEEIVKKSGNYTLNTSTKHGQDI